MSSSPIHSSGSVPPTTGGHSLDDTFKDNPIGASYKERKAERSGEQQSHPSKAQTNPAKDATLEAQAQTGDKTQGYPKKLSYSKTDFVKDKA